MSRKRKPQPTPSPVWPTAFVAVFILGLTLNAMTIGATLHKEKESVHRIESENKPVEPATTLPPPKLTLRELTHEAAKAVGIDPHLFYAQIKLESGGTLHPKNSKAGACGLAQLMPITIRELGVKDCDDPIESAFAGAIYTSRMNKQFGSPIIALVAYNHGPAKTARWLKAGGKWARLPKETRDYVSKITIDAAASARVVQTASIEGE